MPEFLLRDKQAFENYEIIDSIIPLTHSISLEKFNFGNKRLGIPITLSALGRILVLFKWTTIFEKYFPYQINGDCLMGNAYEIKT